MFQPNIHAVVLNGITINLTWRRRDCSEDEQRSQWGIFADGNVVLLLTELHWVPAEQLSHCENNQHKHNVREITNETDTRPNS